MEKHLSRHTYGVLCCIAGGVSWGISGAISEAFFQRYTADPAWVTAVRMTAAGIFLMVWVTAKKQLCFGDLMKDKKSLFQIAAFSLAGLMLCQLAYLNAIRWTNSGTATVLQNLSIAFVAVFLCITSKKLPEKPILIGIALALFGVWLISTGGTPGSMELTPKGLFWGSGRGPRRRQLLPSLEAAGGALGKPPRYGHGHADRRPCPLRGRQGMGNSGRTGSLCTGTFISHCPSGHCRGIFPVSPGHPHGRPDEGLPALLPGTSDSRFPFRLLAAFQLFCGRARWLCMHFGNSFSDTGVMRGLCSKKQREGCPHKAVLPLPDLPAARKPLPAFYTPQTSPYFSPI